MRKRAVNTSCLKTLNGVSQASHFQGICVKYRFGLPSFSAQMLPFATRSVASDTKTANYAAEAAAVQVAVNRTTDPTRVRARRKQGLQRQ